MEMNIQDIDELRPSIVASLKEEGFAFTNEQVEEINEILRIVKYSDSDSKRYYKLLVFLDTVKGA